MVDLMRYKLTLGLLSTFVNDDLSPATAVLFEYELNQYYWSTQHAACYRSRIQNNVGLAYRPTRVTVSYS